MGQGKRKKRSWDEWYALASGYYEAHGDLMVPGRYVTDDGAKLGMWITRQRRRYQGKSAEGALYSDEIERLERIGMQWEARLEEPWEVWYERVRDYHGEHGNLDMPYEYVYKGHKIEQWLKRQRESYRKGRLSQKRIEKLDALGMVWSIDRSRGYKERRRAGFTMAEMLLTVAILGILASLSIVNGVRIQRQMTQKQMDSAAEVVYAAAQNRFNQILAFDRYRRGLLAENEAVAETALNNDRGAIGHPRLRYITDIPALGDASVADTVMTSNSMSGEYYNGSWLIEYNPESLVVTGVFYSAESDAAFYQMADELRESVLARQSYYETSGVCVGYSGIDSGSQNELLAADVPMITEYSVLCNAIATDDGGLSADVELMIPQDEDTGARTISDSGYYAYLTVEGRQSGAKASYRVYVTKLALTRGNYRFSVIVDSGDYPFKDTFGAQGSGGAVRFEAMEGFDGSINRTVPASLAALSDELPGQPSVEYDPSESSGTAFMPGEDVQLTVRAREAETNGRWSNSAAVTVNSLFASAAYDIEGYHARISNARHLQNLDSELSGLTEESCGALFGKYREKQGMSSGYDYIIAEQTRDIDLADVEFNPIKNARLVCYQGKDCELSNLSVAEASGSLGLFGTFSGLDIGERKAISGLTLTAPHIEASSDTAYMGALIGELISPAAAGEPGTVTISDCTVQGAHLSSGYDGTLGIGGFIGRAGTGQNVVLDGCSYYMRADEDIADGETGLSDTNSDGKIDANDAVDWLSRAKSCGGLIGIVDAATPSLAIQDSFAATVIMALGSDTVGGGLIGTAGCPLTVSRSYADCYIRAVTVGGLVGRTESTSAFTSCYSAGFVLYPKSFTVAARFVPEWADGDENIPVITGCYSLFGFSDITQAAKNEETGLPDYTGAGGADHLYEVVRDAEHRISNGLPYYDSRLSSGFLPEISAAGGTDGAPYSLAAYFAGNAPNYGYPHAGLPHYGDFYLEPEEYRVILADDLLETEDHILSMRSTIPHGDYESMLALNSDGGGATVTDPMRLSEIYPFADLTPEKRIELKTARGNWALKGISRGGAGGDYEADPELAFTDGESLALSLQAILDLTDPEAEEPDEWFVEDGEGIWTLNVALRWKKTWNLRVYDTLSSTGDAIVYEDIEDPTMKPLRDMSGSIYPGYKFSGYSTSASGPVNLSTDMTIEQLCDDKRNGTAYIRWEEDPDAPPDEPPDTPPDTPDEPEEPDEGND